MYFIASALLALELVAGAPETFLAEARRALYNQEYGRAEELVRAARLANPDDPESYEFRTTALLVRLTDRSAEARVSAEELLSQCAECRSWRSDCERDIAEGLRVSALLLARDPRDSAARYFHARLLLNQAWLKHLSSSWKGGAELRRGRAEMAALLKDEPKHIRALTALGYIEYRLDTNPLTQLFTGKGSKQRGFAYLATALALAPQDSFERTDAEFALWDMLDREKRTPDAVRIALRLKSRFPENTAVARFLTKNAADGPQR